MKRFFLWVFMVLLLIAIIVFGTLGYIYYNTDTTPPQIAPTLNEMPLTANGYSWNASVLRGLTFKKASAPRTLNADNLGALETAAPKLVLPENMSAQIIIKNSEGQDAFSGDATAYSAFVFTQNGAYTLTAVLKSIADEQQSYGEFYFDAKFAIAVKPTVRVSEERLYQGGVVNVVVSDILDESVPEIATELSATAFTKKEGYYTAVVGIAYNREPGKYPIFIKCGEIVQEYEIEVVHNEFERQDLTMSTEVDSATNTAAANAQFNKEIVSLYNIVDANTYWDGVFVQPCEGRITSQYGLRRYTNGARVPVRHGGIDITCEEGTFIASPNNGKVLFSGMLTLTGNTVVLDHGGGLKSYFYHMNTLAVEKGQMIEKGMKIGEVGTTGYSTGNHLHYEVKIGNQSINPWDLFSGKSGIFFS